MAGYWSASSQPQKMQQFSAKAHLRFRAELLGKN